MLNQVLQRFQNLTRKLKDRNRARSSQRRSRFIESLEERRLLTSYVWTGSLGVDWGNPGNWDTNDGTVPDDAGDTAVINVATNSPALDQARTIGGLSGNGQLNLQSFSLTVDAASSSSFAGSISGTGGLIKQGSADFTLAATNRFSGSLDVNAGTLIAQNTATYRYFQFVPTKFYSASPAAFQLSEFQLTLNGVTQTGATVTNPGGTGNGSAVQDGSLLNGLTDANKAPLVWDFGSPTTIDQYRWATANTTDTSGFPIRWRFEGSDDGSTWRVLDDKTSSDYATPTTAQAFLPSLDVANVLPDAAAVTVSGGGTLVIGQGTEKLGSLAGGGNVVIGDGGLNLAGNASTSFGGVISGTGGVTKNGTGVWTLSGANSYSGHTTLNAGTIRLDANEVVPDGAGKGNLQINSGASLDLHGFSETVNAVTGVGTIDSSVAGNSTISIGSNNQSSSFAGVIKNTAGSVGLSKVGSGTFTISELNTYSGPTNIYQGTLQIAGVVPTYRYFRFSPTLLRNPSSANSIQLSELQVSLGGVRLTGVTATNPGGSNPVGEAAAQSVDNNTATKWLDFNRGSLVLDFGSARSFDQYRWATANDFTDRDAIRWKFEGSTNGSTWIMLDDKTSADYATPTSRFTFLPYFNISGPPIGTAIPDNSPVFVAAAANLNLNNASETIGALSGAGNVLLGTGALTVNNNSDSTFSGLISGSGSASLTKTGTGTWTISNTNSVPGGATVNGGKLEITNTSGSALGTGNVTVNSGGTFAGTGSISGTVTVNNGGIVAPGTSGPGKLTVGAATFSAGSSLDVDLNGTGAGQFDQLVVSSGAVTLGTVGLKPTPGYPAGNGDTYRIIDKLSAGAEAGLVSNVVNSTSAFDVNQSGGDGNDLVLTYRNGAPTVASINDSDVDNVVLTNEAITYTVTFSQDVNHTTVSNADFSNAGTSVITVGAITETSPGIFNVVVTPTSAGTVILQIPNGATILDNAGNAVVGPVTDNDTITVQTPPPIAWTFSSASNGSISGYTLGSQFSTSAPLFISALGMYAPSGLTGNYSVGLWTTGGALLAQTTVAPTDTLINQFRYHDLTVPLQLSAGTYVVGAYYGSTAVYGYSAIDFKTLPGVTFVAAAYAPSSDLAFPGNFAGGFTGYFGANFLTVSNSAPTDISLSNGSVAENLPIDTTVGTLSSIDPDSGNTFTYSLVSGSGSTDNASFTIDGSTLKTAAMFNFEAKSSYSIRVRTTDQGGLSYEKVLTISVTNVNETPTDISLSNSSVAENLASGTTVGTVSTSDPDNGNTFTYSLVSGDGSSDNLSFSIDGSTLKTAAVFDFETKSSYSIRVRTTDQGGLSFEKAFTIGVSNVAEDTTAPTATVRPLPLTTAVSTITLTIDSNDPAGAVGDPVSGVASYDIYVAVDSGGWSLFAANIPASQSTVDITGSSNHRYWFRAVAKDSAGNVEVESSTPAAEANTYFTDFEAPNTAVVSATADANGLFTLNLQGSDVGGSTISRFRVFVKVDDGTPVEITQSNVAGGTPNSSGVQSATTNYQGLRDGASHSYTFFTRAIDTNGNLEAAPTDANADIRQTHTFSPPAALAATGIDVENGANQRSYIRYVDVLFNDVSGLQTLIDNNRFQVEKFALNNNTPVQGTGTAITGFSAARNSNSVKLNFGANGIGGPGNTGNGFYRISIDMDGDSQFDDAHFEFFRLWADNDGNGIINDADRTVTNDLNGDGVINATDRSYWRNERNKKLHDDLFALLDD